MKRYLHILSIALIHFQPMAAMSAETNQASRTPSAAPLFPPGQSIPIAKQREFTQIGRATDHKSHRCIIIGTADVFGHGPYDLFLFPNRLFPFVRFDEGGTPLYGEPIETKGIPMHGTVMTGADGTIHGVFSNGKSIRLCKFDKSAHSFESIAESPPLDLPGDMNVGVGAFVDQTGKLHTYSSVSDGVTYRPPPPPDYQPKGRFPYYHDASYIPYDGAGIWRGNIHRRMLFHTRFDSLSLTKVEVTERASTGPGEFLFEAWGMTVANHGSDRPRAVISGEHLGMFHYFKIDPSTGSVSAPLYVNNQEQVGLRHPVINSSVKVIPDPLTGNSNLIVGDSGRVWFYRFAGQFTPQGAPIYESAKPVMGKGIPLSLGELPIISHGDVDRDGRIDLIAGNDAGQLMFLKNIGTKGRPEFDHPVEVKVGGKPLNIKAGYRGSIQGPSEAMWGYTCPTLHDWNGDGRLDVVLNSVMGDYQVLLQDPSTGTPTFTEPKLLYCDGLQLHLVWRSQPAVTNWGKPNGRLCMIALDEQNLLRCFWRIDNENVERGELLPLPNGSPITANADEAAGQTGRAKLVAHDWDADGAIDLLVGTSRGLSFPAAETEYYPSSCYPENKASVLFLKNVGTNEKPVFDYARLLEFEGKRIGLAIHCCSPAPVDLGRGVIDLLLGEEDGTIQYYPGESLSISAPAK